MSTAVFPGLSPDRVKNCLCFHVKAFVSPLGFSFSRANAAVKNWRQCVLRTILLHFYLRRAGHRVFRVLVVVVVVVVVGTKLKRSC